MDLSTGWLVSSSIVGAIGLGLFVYGKKQLRIPPLAVGLALMVFPYFVASPLWIGVGAGVLVGGLWLATRAGL